MRNVFARLVRVSPAMVVAMLALFVALTGTAVATTSALITGNQIKNNSITGLDIKNKSVTAKDIKGQLRGARGLRGVTGATGAKGDKGDKGDPGPSDARATQTTGNVQLGTSEASPLVVDSLALAAGKWVLTATTALTNISAATRSAWCSLKSGTVELGRTRAFDVADQRSSDATVLGQVDLPNGGTVEFHCFANAAGVYTPSDSKPAMQAIKVAVLTVD